MCPRRRYCTSTRLWKINSSFKIHTKAVFGVGCGSPIDGVLRLLRWLERIEHPDDVGLAAAFLVLRQFTSLLRQMSRDLRSLLSERLPKWAVYNEKYSHQTQDTNVRLSFTDTVGHIQPISKTQQVYLKFR